MTYAHTFLTRWKDGAFFDYTGATVIVSWDQTNTAYTVDPNDRQAFEAWALEVFGGDNTDPDDIAIRWL